MSETDILHFGENDSREEIESALEDLTEERGYTTYTINHIDTAPHGKFANVTFTRKRQ